MFRGLPIILSVAQNLQWTDSMTHPQIVEHLKGLLKGASETQKQSPLAFLHQ